jgi:hypothetical protein
MVPIGFDVMPQSLIPALSVEATHEKKKKDGVKLF